MATSPDARRGEGSERSRSPRERWQDHLNSKAPTGLLDTRMRGGKGDAYRHYVTNAMLAQVLGRNAASLFGYLSEAFGSNDEADRTMDINNNLAGAKAGSDLSGLGTHEEFMVEVTIKFINDVASGRIKLNDGDGDRGPRDSGPSDFFDGSALEDRYRPDKADAPETMNA
ncbi:MAG: hypothetical protein M3Q08_00295 [Pseudomonadota bacterium]|nr:hypothetical protein [Pseudomonadota bacterium]